MCRNGGTCYAGIEGFFCSCRPEFSGAICEQQIASTATSQVDIVFVVVVSLICILIIVLLVLSLLFVRSVKRARATRGTYSPRHVVSIKLSPDSIVTQENTGNVWEFSERNSETTTGRKADLVTENQL